MSWSVWIICSGDAIALVVALLAAAAWAMQWVETGGVVLSEARRRVSEAWVQDNRRQARFAIDVRSRVPEHLAKRSPRGSGSDGYGPVDP